MPTLPSMSPPPPEPPVPGMPELPASGRALNAFRGGARSRRLKPFYDAVGPEAAEVAGRGFARAVADAPAAAPQGRTRAEARARSQARHRAFMRVAACLTYFRDTYDRDDIFPGLAWRPAARAVYCAVALSSIWLGAPELDPPLVIAPPTAHASREVVIAPSELPSPHEERGAGGEAHKSQMSQLTQKSPPPPTNKGR